MSKLSILCKYWILSRVKSFFASTLGLYQPMQHDLMLFFMDSPKLENPSASDKLQSAIDRNY